MDFSIYDVHPNLPLMKSSNQSLRDQKEKNSPASTSRDAEAWSRDRGINLEEQN